MAHTKTIPSAGWFTCCHCGERLAPGSIGLRDGSRWSHRTPCVATATATASTTAPAARPVPYARTFGALSLDGESFRAWEREYEQEG